MTKASKTGLTVMGIGLLVWIAPVLYARYLIPMPLSLALPLSPGASLREQFNVRGAQHYEVLLRWTKVGKFMERWTNFLNSENSQKVPCQINLRILRDGREVHSADLTSLEPAGLSGDNVFWSLGPLASLPSGNLELQLTNGTDLTYLTPSEPTVQIRVTDMFTENLVFDNLLGRVAGGALSICGIAVFVVGLFVKKQF